MVHVRLNERETNPNPHINFITALPMPDAAEQEGARQLLRALAAQVRPVMRAHGFVVNSFEEVRAGDITEGYTDRIAVRVQQGICGEELEQWGSGRYVVSCDSRTAQPDFDFQSWFSGDRAAHFSQYPGS